MRSRKPALSITQSAAAKRLRAAFPLAFAYATLDCTPAESREGGEDVQQECVHIPSAAGRCQQKNEKHSRGRSFFPVARARPTSWPSRRPRAGEKRGWSFCL